MCVIKSPKEETRKEDGEDGTGGDGKSYPPRKFTCSLEVYVHVRETTEQSNPDEPFFQVASPSFVPVRVWSNETDEPNSARPTLDPDAHT